MYGDNANRTSSAYLPVVNLDSEASVPPFGLMQSIGINSDGTANIVRPDGDSIDLLVNRGAAIPRLTENGTDNRGSGHAQFPTVVAYQNDNEGGFAPIAGEIWGPRPGSWYLHKNGRGFRILGGGANGLVNVEKSGATDPRRVQLLEPLAACGSAKAIEMNWSAARQNWCDFGDTITVYDSASIVQTEIDIGYWLWATFQPDSQLWEVESVGSDGCCGGSGSGPAFACVTTLGGVDVTKLPMIDPDGSAPLALYVQDGCLVLGPTKQCGLSGSGS